MARWIFICTLGLSWLAFHSSALAEIYNWTDANGVPHYTNTQPPGKITARQEAEIPYDRAADEASRAAEAADWAQRKLEQKAEQKGRIEEQLQEANQQISRLEAKTQAALKAAKQAEQKASKQDKHRRVYPYGLYPYAPPYSAHRPKPELEPNSARKDRRHQKRDDNSSSLLPNGGRAEWRRSPDATRSGKGLEAGAD